MPKCTRCHYFDPVKIVCTNNGKPNSPTRACMGAILYKNLKNMSGNILEIGFGKSRVCRKAVRNQGCVWYGVDPRYPTNEAERVYQAVASKMPFQDNFFDGAFALETIEHWAEKGDTVPSGLNEINRVLKPGSKLIVTVPVHYHGGLEFVAGDIPKILSYWDSKIWKTEILEEWRKEFAPLPVFEPWKQGRESVIWIPLVAAHSTQPIPSAWTLEVVMSKIGKNGQGGGI